MGSRSDNTDPKRRLSPTATVAHLTDDYIDKLAIPPLPPKIPKRLAEAIERRISALLFHLREAKRRRYFGALEIRLVRDAHRAVLTSYELQLPDCDVHYARFRQLVQDLGYERVDVGFVRSETLHGSDPAAQD